MTVSPAQLRLDEASSSLPSPDQSGLEICLVDGSHGHHFLFVFFWREGAEQTGHAPGTFLLDKTGARAPWLE